MPNILEPQLILVDKPAGVTSHDVVAFLRREFRSLDESGKRLLIGHSGTLDPFATGLMIILVGPAVKAQSEFLGSAKRYQATLQLGQATDTGDLDGQITTNQAVPPVTTEQIEKMFANWPSPFTQAVPAYAAAKIDGRKLYQYARQGQTPSRWPIRVARANDWQLNSLKDNEITFTVTVTAGCYIRSLAEAIAHRLGTVGHLTALRRLSSGSLSVDDALPIDLPPLDR